MFLGAASYYLVPSLGPVFARPELYDRLPGVAGFASLHVSIVFTAALVAHLVGLPRVVRWSLWAFLGGTMVATACFGWHDLVDALAGLALGAIAVALEARSTRGLSDRADRPERPATGPEPWPAPFAPTH